MKKYIPFLLIILILISACGGIRATLPTPQFVPDQAQPPIPKAYWPTDGWRMSAPEDQGMDAGRLNQMFENIDQRRLRIDSVLVVRNGYIVAEKYYAPDTIDTQHVLYSCTKSFISALIGIAIEDGYIENVNQPVLSFFPDHVFENVEARKEAMALEDLLTMRSGLAWNEGMAAYQGMMGSSDWVTYVLDQQMVADPGTQFNYCSGCSHVMSAIIEETTGIGTLAFAEENLFEPLGINNYDWELDSRGIPNGGWGLHMTPREMAKFGYLFLHEGEWDGQQIVPAEWVQNSTQAGLATGEGVDYAYQWWVYPDDNLYAAQGLNGQMIYVIPDLALVVVFTADMADPSPIFGLLEDWIVPAVR
jgi:CubicO group peptidase (beta-lactamase class C family)